MNAEQNAPPKPARKKHPWWFWGLIGLGGAVVSVVLLAVVLAVAGFAYANSMVKNYTTTSPKPLPKVQHDPKAAKQLQKELGDKWARFSKAVMNRETPPPFKISASDINLMLGQQPPFRDNVRFVVTNSELLAEFSAPLDQIGWANLKGRYLNGTAHINIVFQDGWLTVSLGTVEANGKPLPGLLLKRIQRQNFLNHLDRNKDFVSLMQEIESIEIKDDSILVTPAK